MLGHRDLPILSGADGTGLAPSTASIAAAQGVRDRQQQIEEVAELATDEADRAQAVSSRLPRRG